MGSQAAEAHPLGAVVLSVSLEALLTEWARWCSQGCQWGQGYPSEATHEHIAVPFRRAPTTQEALDELEASRAADERIGLRVESWVRALHDPMRTVIRVHYVELPEGDRGGLNRTQEQWQQWRARHAGRKLNRQMTVDQYDDALYVAMQKLEDMELLWARGV